MLTSNILINPPKLEKLLKIPFSNLINVSSGIIKYLLRNNPYKNPYITITNIPSSNPPKIKNINSIKIGKNLALIA